jgi:hypothetical protein
MIKTSKILISKKEQPGVYTVYTQPLLSKMKRSFRKADKSATEEEQIEFARTLIDADVAVLDCSSKRISKVIRGELSIEDLK